jgi:signal peptidase I
MISDKKNVRKRLLSKEPKKWIRFCIWVVITFFFTFWTRSLWWLIAIPFFFDFYLSRIIPWGFWKSFKNKTIRSLFDWIDAIVFALAAVYIINIFFFQNYQIPSSSLEKSLLVGDFLFVSKLSYGPRVPNTPVSFPLAQNTIPVLNIKSYLDKPHWDYKRVPGFGHIKRNDIVVFNFPAGDTIPLKVTNPDFYSLSYALSQENSLTLEEAKEYINKHPDDYGKLIYRPVDKRENYVKRCVGLPGDTLQIINNHIYINGVTLPDAPEVQYNYYVQTKGNYLSERQFRLWNISLEDRQLWPINNMLTTLLPLKINENGSINPVYVLPLTKPVLEQVKNSPNIDTVFIEKDSIGTFPITGFSYPLNPSIKWSRDNYGPLWIPKKGATIELTDHNLILYSRVIRNYEGNDLKVVGGIAYINGVRSTSYTFKMDYYWMMGDNRHKSADSRYWGFVPEDHVVGKPIVVWLSLDKDRGLFEGKIRWKRFFKKAS